MKRVDLQFLFYKIVFVTTRVGLKIAVKDEPIFFSKRRIFSETAELRFQDYQQLNPHTKYGQNQKKSQDTCGV